MKSLPRISYREKYLFWRNASLILGVSFILSLVFWVRAAKANLQTQAMLINPGIAATIEVIK